MRAPEGVKTLSCNCHNRFHTIVIQRVALFCYSIPMERADIYLTDCPESALGGLSGADALPDIKRIKGIDIPLNVLRELQRLGHPIEQYTRGELLEAVRACAMDANLVDDPHGHSFSDKLTLTADEKKAREPKKKSFCTDIKHERECRKEHMHACEHEDDLNVS